MCGQKGVSISNPISQVAGLSTPVARPAKSKLQRSLHKLFSKKSTRRRLITTSIVAGNIAILAVVIGVIVLTPKQSVGSASLAATDSDSEFAANPLDHVSSAGIAKTVAQMSSLPETVAVTNQADSETVDLTLAPTAANVVEKPSVVSTSAYASNKDIKSHVVVAGETISSIASKYSVTSDSVRWSNDLSGDAVAPNTKLRIPPVTGMVYTVKPGDTPVTLAAKFKADQNKIIAFNDAEVTGLQVGSVILIPDGQKATAVPGIVRGGTGTGIVMGGKPSYGAGAYNGYDFGYCTWWVASLRAKEGRPVPMNLGNAATWARRAAAMGLPTGSTPRVGSAVVTKTAGAGHVAYVTAVNGDGTITISEMNHKGWNKINDRVLPQSPSYSYVY